jgi:hypothetical protein
VVNPSFFIASIDGGLYEKVLIRSVPSCLFFPPFALKQKVEPKIQGQPDPSGRLAGPRTAPLRCLD